MSTLVSTKGRYALRAMADLAENQHDGLVPLAEIAHRQDISEKYLESIANALSKAGFIDGHRGKHGGYRLTREPESYTVESILEVVEGKLATVACLECGQDGCDSRDTCTTLPMWEELDGIIYDYLSHMTLADLMKPADPDVLKNET